MTEANDDETDIVYDNDTTDEPAASAPQVSPSAESPFGDDGMLKPEFVPTPKAAAPVDDRFDENGMLKPEFVPKPKAQPTA